MRCECVPGIVLEATQVETLVDLARADDASTFAELARAVGVPAARVAELWRGTRQRVASDAVTRHGPFGSA
jgi:hypothetical protein